MTLDEYEKVLEEKRKALLALKTEERKVSMDKDLVSMQLLSSKKSEEEIFVKLVRPLTNYATPFKLFNIQKACMPVFSLFLDLINFRVLTRIKEKMLLRKKRKLKRYAFCITCRICYLVCFKICN